MVPTLNASLSGFHVLLAGMAAAEGLLLMRHLCGMCQEGGGAVPRMAGGFILESVPVDAAPEIFRKGIDKAEG